MRRTLLGGAIIVIVLFAILMMCCLSGRLTGHEQSRVQKLVIDDRDMRIEILLNSTYYPGDIIRADFYITNKLDTIDRVDLKLDVYYGRIKVFSYQHPSWREYIKGRTVHIFYESRLPLITPPGRYTLKFYITPKSRETKITETSIVIIPSVRWMLLFIALFSVGILVIMKFQKYISHLLKHFSLGQQFVLFSIMTLSGVPLALLMGTESYANNLSLLSFYLLLIGIINLWIEIFKIRLKEKESLREISSLYLLTILFYLEKGVFFKYLGILTAVWGTALLLKILPLKRRE